MGGTGSTVAVAALADGLPSWRVTRSGGEPRGIFCGIGHCHDCLVLDPDGRTARACLLPTAAVIGGSDQAPGGVCQVRPADREEGDSLPCAAGAAPSGSTTRIGPRSSLALVGRDDSRVRPAPVIPASAEVCQVRSADREEGDSLPCAAGAAHSGSTTRIGPRSSLTLVGRDDSRVRPRAAAGQSAAPHPPADVLVIGAGPGGLTAAADLADGGLEIVLVDRYARAGGQIGRQPAGTAARTGGLADAIGRAETHPRIAVQPATAVVALRRLDHRAGFEALLETAGTLHLCRTRAVVLAPGAREVVMPFPGWTLPGVVTAGAVQALVKAEGRLPWTRVGLAGSGPLLLAVAAALRQAGHPPAFTLEARALRDLVGTGLPTALRHPAKGLQFAALAGPHPPRFGWRVLEAVGSDRLRAAVIAPVDPDGRVGRRRTVGLDALGISHRLVPDVGLALQLGCDTRSSADRIATAVVVDEVQATSVPLVHAVGEITGVGGDEKARAEGRLAAAALLTQLAGHRSPPAALRRAATRWRRFADDLERLHPVDDDWAATTPDAVLACRCEEVPLGEVRRAIADGATTARAVKGLTRCGMGPCQGAVCSPIVRSALAAAGHADTGDLESRPLAAPVAADQLARLA
ncbi:FAD-dependent oxidoreductase [Euzebya sp.]|uniref:FAD-dependent oxidoreductase n=1 Tax=Euzebya sp. TaxID=1971409 RepID=UPI003511D782